MGCKNSEEEDSTFKFIVDNSSVSIGHFIVT
eukprot:CAMPEP_0113727938 /NCGR_PEP_ID=MMETSP0038_2-20120614/41535_1 /TAXON_ID=2898 /ORGANISM="Cryptomonas paramecium" /LENGTH=30 /DNA_ID=CAMNT_0000659251 /DNA_START=822 /DNA_END=911 /DNA_ORIENTATION=+ /assembly_acc=CAM_ASM_000170